MAVKPVDILSSCLLFKRAGTRCRPYATLEETPHGQQSLLHLV